MIKHAAVSGILVVLLVAALMYSISPGEVQIVYSAAKNRFSTGGVHSLEEMLPGGGKSSFESFGPRKPPGGSCLSTWLKGPQAVAVLITIAAVVLAGEYRRRRRRKFTIEERMAITLSKAVRHDVSSGGT